MYSKKAENYMRKTLQNVQFWGCSTLRWEPATKEAEIATSGPSRYLWFVNFLLHMAHLSFLLVRYVQYNLLNHPGAQSARVHTEYAVIAYSLPVILHMTMYFRLDDLKYFLSNYMKFYRQIEEKTGLKVTVGKDCDRFLAFMIRSGQLICWANLIVAFRRPARPILLSSLMPNPQTLKPWQIAPYVLPHALVWWTMWANMHLYSIHLVAYISATVATTEELKSLPNKGVRAPARFAKTYRTMQILMKSFDWAYGPPVAAHKVLFAMIIIRNMHGALTQEGEIRVLRGIIGVAAWLYLEMAFKLIGSVHESCAEMLPAWNPWRKDLWFRRFLVSCRNLRVDIVGFYFVDRKMALTLAAIILESIVNMVIAERE